MNAASDLPHLARGGKGIAPPTEQMKRDILGLWMLAAFNGVDPSQLPSDPRYTHFANESMAKAWGRVADVARAWVMAEMVAARAYPKQVEELAAKIKVQRFTVPQGEAAIELTDHEVLVILTALRKSGDPRDITQPVGTFSDLLASGPLPPSKGDCSPRLSPCGTFAIHQDDCVVALERGLPRESLPKSWPLPGEGPFATTADE